MVSENKQTVLVRVCIVVINTMTESKLEKTGFIWLKLLHHVLSLNKLNECRNLKAGAESEAIEEL